MSSTEPGEIHSIYGLDRDDRMAPRDSFSNESVMTTPSVCPKCKAKVILFGFLVFTFGRLIGILSAQSMPGESGRFEVASIRPSGAKG
jgi:hypothetical protein